MKVSISYDGKYCETFCHLLIAETHAGFLDGKARCIKFGELETITKDFTVEPGCGGKEYRFLRSKECVRQTKELKPEDIELVHEPWGRFK